MPTIGQTDASIHSAKGRSQYTPAELESLIDWIAEVIAEERIKEVLNNEPSTPE